MATFHRMVDESGREVVRCLVKGAPDQLLARASSHLDPALATAPADDHFKARYMEENERLAAQGLRVMATARKDFPVADFDPGADLLDLMDGLTLLADNTSAAAAPLLLPLRRRIANSPTSTGG